MSISATEIINQQNKTINDLIHRVKEQDLKIEELKNQYEQLLKDKDECIKMVKEQDNKIDNEIKTREEEIKKLRNK